MNSNRCPACNNVAISYLKKSFYPPAKKFDCPHCGKCIGLSVSASLTLMFVAIAIGKSLMAFKVGDWVSLSVGIAVVLFFQACIVKLILKERNSGIEL